MDSITVKVGELYAWEWPYKTTNPNKIALNGDRTVRAALDAAELNPAGFQIRVDGNDATLDTVLEDGSTVFLIKKKLGNADYITVKVGKLPGAVNEIALNGDRTVKAALDAAELNPAGFQIRVDGNDATVDTVLEDGSTVFLVKKIKGN